MRVIAVGLLLLSSGLGCGGSSSETPPPLEPDPTSGRYLGPRLPKEDTSAPIAPEADEDDLPVRPRRPATSTWGSGKAAPSATAAPSMTSPTALPPPSSGPN